MTTTTPELDSPLGMYGGARVSHVKNLLARASVVGSSNGLSPTIIAKMRRHYQVASSLTVQSLPLMRADWSIECEDDKIREALTEAYRTVAFDVHRTMTRALWAGYSPNTITWTYREDLRGFYPSEIRDLVPDTCVARVDENGTLDGFEQKIAGQVVDEVDPLYCLWITEGMESGNYYGRSILDAALDPYSDHAAIRAFHARYLERFGEPVVIARAPSGSSIANRDAIDAAVAARESDPSVVVPEPILEPNLDTALNMGENLRHHSVVALPSTLLFGADGKPTGFAWNLEFLEAKGGSGTDFLDALRELDKRIARAMFVPDLLIANTEDVGSNALGASHKSVWSESVEGRLDDYSRQITAQLLEPARILNFGLGSSPVRLVFAPLANEAIDRFWSLVEILASGGRLPVDVDELAESLGIPLLDAASRPTDPVAEGLRLKSLAKRDADTSPIPVLAELLSHDDRPAYRFAAENPVDGLPEWKIPQSYDPPPFRRELNARERRVGFAKLEEGLNRTEARILDALEEILGTEHDRVLRQLNGIIRKGTPAEILEGLGTIEIKGGPAVVKLWSELMSDVSGIAVEQLRGELASYADSVKDLGPEGRALFRSYAQTSADRVLSNLLTETRLQLLNAYTSGVSRAGMASVVGQVFDAYTSSEGKPVRLTTRMLSAKSLNYSRAAAVERGGIPLAGAQYSAILDRRTCELCEKLDENVIAIEHTDLARFTPPVHHNCRCVWVWITRDEEDFTPTWKTPSKSDVDRFGGLVF